MPQTTKILQGEVELPRVHLCRLARIDHWHLTNMSMPHWRYYAPIETGGELSFEKNTHQLNPSTWLLIPPHTSSRARLLQPFRKAYCHFSWSLLDKRPRPGIYAGSIPQEQREALCQLAEHPHHAGRKHEFALRLRAMVTMALLQLPNNAFEPVARYNSQLINRAAAMLCADLRQTPSNEELAKELHLHSGSLVRMFTREVGISPQRYAMQHRLEHAAILLLETQDSIEEITDACGFGDRYHFSRAFAQHWKIPPASYRKQGRG